ncbi:terminase large subunit [Carnobacterium divergens]|nr:terminase large subunit [Carnobacterium divergens]
MVKMKNIKKITPHITEWLELVKTGKFVACKEQLELMEFVEKRIYDDDIVIREDLIDKAIERSETYFFKLYPFQRFFTSFVYGVYKADGSLLYDEYLFLAGRGTGKNGLLSTIIFNLPDINNIPKYNIDIVATSEQQAMTSFDEVYDVIDMKEKLKKFWRHTKKVIQHKKLRAKIKYHTSNARTKDGLRPGAVIFDEIHEFENDELINVFTSALGKVDFARIFYLTTDGYIRGGFLDELKKLVKEIFAGEVEGLNILPFIFKLDDPEEVHNPLMWLKAIPMLEYDPVLLRQVTKEYKKALNSPSKMIEFLTKRMNIPTQDAFAAVAEWDDILATDQEIPDLTGWQCVGAVDYADVRDFVAVGLLFRKGDKRYWLHHSFICHRSLKLTKFKFDIDRAVKEGYCEIVQDDMVLPETVANWFVEKNKTYRILKVAADDWRLSVLKDKFIEKGIPLEKVRSGPLSHGKLAPLVDSLFAMHNIVFGKDFMMRWYTNNVFVKFDSKGNKTYEKIEPKTRKTDGFMALVHALLIEPEYKAPAKFNRKLKTRTY